MSAASRESTPEHSVVETIQSLILAFVLAMTFRGFVAEGFVIPTGSMAPTLMGRHVMYQSTQTGYPTYFGIDREIATLDLPDPILGPMYQVPGPKQAPSRMGDRILVLKSLYPFREPDRWDVVVFKNPTDPHGDAENYIKRLIGLPNESILIVDGDIFVNEATKSREWGSYQVQRKPEHVQRAVWQPLANSDYVPRNASGLRPAWKPVWAPTSDNWDTSDPRGYLTRDDAPAQLRWDPRRREINDWSFYNMHDAFIRGSTRRSTPTPYIPEDVSDLRVTASITPLADGLGTTLTLMLRSHRIDFVIEGTEARVRMERLHEDGSDSGEMEFDVATSILAPEANTPLRVECWHVDQQVWLFIDDELILQQPYDWAPISRMQNVSHSNEDDMSALYLDARASRQQPEIIWDFVGAPCRLDRIRVDRDLHYRTTQLRNFTNPVADDHAHLVRGNGYGTSPAKPAVLGPDHFFMLGDNSQASSDSRAWGPPHPLVAEQVDDMPFVVNRRLLLGKAWVVYFPAPYGFVPDFGRLRFIR